MSINCLRQIRPPNNSALRKILYQEIKLVISRAGELTHFSIAVFCTCFGAILVTIAVEICEFTSNAMISLNAFGAQFLAVFD